MNSEITEIRFRNGSAIVRSKEAADELEKAFKRLEVRMRIAVEVFQHSLDISAESFKSLAEQLKKLDLYQKPNLPKMGPKEFGQSLQRGKRRFK